MLYEFAGVKVEVRETEQPKDLDYPLGLFVDYGDEIVLEWVEFEDSPYPFRVCDHCDEIWEEASAMHAFNYFEAEAKDIYVSYSVSKEEDPDWDILVCPVCAKKFKEMGLKEIKWWED